MKRLTLKVIGTIHSPFRQAQGTPIQSALAQGVEGSTKVFPEFVPGLQDLEGFERIWLLYWLDRASAAELVVKPFLDKRKCGIFATRAPCRPNPLGLSCVRLLGIEGGGSEWGTWMFWTKRRCWILSLMRRGWIASESGAQAGSRINAVVPLWLMAVLNGASEFDKQYEPNSWTRQSARLSPTRCRRNLLHGDAGLGRSRTHRPSLRGSAEHFAWGLHQGGG